MERRFIRLLFGWAGLTWSCLPLWASATFVIVRLYGCVCTSFDGESVCMCVNLCMSVCVYVCVWVRLRSCTCVRQADVVSNRWWLLVNDYALHTFEHKTKSHPVRQKILSPRIKIDRTMCFKIIRGYTYFNYFLHLLLSALSLERDGTFSNFPKIKYFKLMSTTNVLLKIKALTPGMRNTGRSCITSN